MVAGGDGRRMSLVAEEVAEEEARGQSRCHWMKGGKFWNRV